jgi:hypothetical protein
MTSGRMVKQVKKQVKNNLAMRLYELVAFTQDKPFKARWLVAWAIVWKSDPMKFK